MVDNERGDKSFSFGKKMITSYMGKNNQGGIEEVTGFSSSIARVKSYIIGTHHLHNVQMESSRQELLPGCSFHQLPLSTLRCQPSHLTASSLHCVVQVKRRLSGKPQLSSVHLSKSILLHHCVVPPLYCRMS